MKKQLILVTLFTSLCLYAQESNELESFFDEITEFTTQTNININHQPSVLTLVYAKDLQEFGVRNLQEALDFVPGIETSVTISGANHIIVRGSNQPFSTVFEKIKFFIDGVDINFIYYSNFPIELIERIEVLRGGASAIYGQGAFVGAVNIVTKASLSTAENNIAFEAGSFNNTKASTTLHTKLDMWDIGIDAHYQEHDRKVDAPNAKEAVLYGFSDSISRKKESLEGLKDKGFNVNIHNSEWTFTTRYLQTYTQNYYGFFGLLDHNDKGYSQFTTSNAQLSYKSKLSDNLTLKANTGILRNNYKLNTYLYKLEPNLYGFKDPHYRVDYTKQTSYGELSLGSKYFKNHQILVGAYIGNISLPKNEFHTNADKSAKVGMEFPVSSGDYWPIDTKLTSLSGANGFVDIPSEQLLLSYYFQDLYSVNDNLDIALNIRLDDYEFFDSMLSWRAASVYSRDNTNIFKAIYSRAYRAPFFIESFFVEHFEVAGNPTLKPEKVDTFEIEYIHSKFNQTFKTNAYYLVYNNPIDIKYGADYNYHNNPNNLYSYGLELEYKASFENRSKLMVNASYTKFKYANEVFKGMGTVKLESPDISEFITHIAYLYPLNSSLTWGNTLRHYSKKEPSSSSYTIDAVTLIDSTINYHFKKDFTASFTMKNLLNTKYYYPDNGINTSAMQREGRTLYANLQYNF